MGKEKWVSSIIASSIAMGAVECLVEKAAEMGQCWLRGIATARWLATR
jgi:hypothetical protein